MNNEVLRRISLIICNSCGFIPIMSKKSPVFFLLFYSQINFNNCITFVATSRNFDNLSQHIIHICDAPHTYTNTHTLCDATVHFMSAEHFVIVRELKPLIICLQSFILYTSRRRRCRMHQTFHCALSFFRYIIFYISFCLTKTSYTTTNRTD